MKSLANDRQDIVASHAPAVSVATVVLHWLVAVAMIGMLFFGLAIWLTPGGSAKTALIPLHKSLGLIVGLLAVARIAFRIYEGFPAPAPSNTSRVEIHAARFVHVTLLLATLILPLSGIAKSLTYARPVSVFGFEVIPQVMVEKNEVWHRAASFTHDASAILLAALLLAHIAAALYHHIIRRDAILKRMLGLGN